MKTFEFTFPTPQQNLACDEALLDLCEEGFDDELLRFWEPLEHFVVLGYSNKMRSEINELSCREARIPVLRRPSGGGTVLQGPGCLNFSLILRLKKHPGLENITRTNHFILEQHRQALQNLLRSTVEIQGISDLAIGGLKFSGNAQRRKKEFLLFHGTFLCNFDIPLIEKFLSMPSKEPPYRKNRPHKDFLMNLDLPSHQVIKAIKEIWEAAGTFNQIPFDKIEKLVGEKYSKDEWNLKF